MVYSAKYGDGYYGADWLKYKDAGSNEQLRGLLHWKDYRTGASIYVLGNTLNSYIGSSPQFKVEKTNTDSNSSSWKAITPNYQENKCFTFFKSGEPRVSGRLNNNQQTFGTSIGTYTSVQNRAVSTTAWVDMGADEWITEC